MPEHVGGQLKARDEADDADDGEGDLVFGQESLHRVSLIGLESYGT